MSNVKAGKMQHYILVVPILLLMLGTTTLVTLAQSDAEVVKSFKQYVYDYLASYKTNRRELVDKLGGGWAKMYFIPSGGLGVDVRKTDSLVSPYVGVLEFTMTRPFTAFHKTKAEAEVDNNFIQSTTTKHRHTYAFQDGAWSPTSYQCNLVGLDKWLDCEQPGDGL